MTTRLSEITDYLESIAPLRFQESYDNSGLILGDISKEITGAVISLDCTPDVVSEAIKMNCNLVISHHPIIFKGIRKFSSGNYVDEAVMMAIKNDVALYAIHTNLDNVLNNGVNERIAQQLGLIVTEPLKALSRDVLETDYTLGSGIIAKLEKPVDEESFLTDIKKRMRCGVIKHTEFLKRPVSKVAICGGSGSFLLQEAILCGANMFISSDFKYHDYFDANGQIVIVDIGHYESEFFTIQLLFELVKKKFPNFAAHCTKVTTNPVRYF